MHTIGGPLPLASKVATPADEQNSRAEIRREPARR